MSARTFDIFDPKNYGPHQGEVMADARAAAHTVRAKLWVNDRSGSLAVHLRPSRIKGGVQDCLVAFDLADVLAVVAASPVGYELMMDAAAIARVQRLGDEPVE